jgi:hypothetical protein
VGDLFAKHRKQTKDLISILMESCFYSDLTLKDRLGLVRALMAKMVCPD